MSTLRNTAALAATSALFAAPLVAISATPAAAVDRSGRCDGARFSLDVERDDGRFEVEAEIDDAPRGSRWRIVVKQDGKRFIKTTRVARNDDDDRDGDISIDRNRPNTPGRDVFRITVNKVGTPGSCSRVVRLR